MIKYIKQSAYMREGEKAVRAISEESGLLKDAKFEELHDDLKAFIRDLKPREGYGYLLISALSDENWGPNNNADMFPTEALSNPTDDFGYKTYMKYGHWYRLHQNKDPQKSYGKVIYSYWNPQMHRIELIVEYNKAIDDWTEEALRNNADIEVSMGLKINYDICPVCHPNWRVFYKIPEEKMKIISKTHDIDVVYNIGKEYGVDLSYISELNFNGGAKGISRNATTYCEHIKYDKKKIMPDGQLVYMVNLRPIFFDISYVRRHADKSSYVLAKIASLDGHISTEDTITEEELDTVLENKVAGAKVSEMVKEVEPQILSRDTDEISEYIGRNVLPVLRDDEKEIPAEVLNEMAERAPIEDIISSCIGLGMFPKPREFQRLVLVNRGCRRDADRYERQGMIITDELADHVLSQRRTWPVADIGPHRLNDRIMEMLMPYTGQKSYYSGPVAKRLIIIKTAGALDTSVSYDTKSKSPWPVMLLAAAGYLGLAKLSGNTGPIVKEMAKNKYKLLAGAVGAGLAYEIASGASKEWDNNVRYIMEKNSAIEKDASVLGKFMLIPGITIPTYVASEHYRRKAMAGHPTGKIKETLIRHPGRVALGSIALAYKPSRDLIGYGIKGTAKTVGKLFKGGMSMDGFDITDYPISKHAEIIAAYWEAMLEGSI
jgi:hypothetical protein